MLNLFFFICVIQTKKKTFTSDFIVDKNTYLFTMSHEDVPIILELVNTLRYFFFLIILKTISTQVSRYNSFKKKKKL